MQLHKMQRRMFHKHPRSRTSLPEIYVMSVTESDSSKTDLSQKHELHIESIVHVSDSMQGICSSLKMAHGKKPDALTGHI